jgi:Flp pilus assembly protein CpaB
VPPLSAAEVVPVPVIQFPLVRARRLAARPVVRRSAVVVLALVTGLAVASLVQSGEAARRSWGASRPVAVATRDLAPGDVLSPGAVEVRRLPEAVVPAGASASAPVGAVVRQPVVAGEPLVPARLAPDGLTGTAALVPEGFRAVAVPLGPTGVPPLAVGDEVDVLAVVPPDLVAAEPGGDDRGSGPAFPLVERALVVDVGEEAASVAVPQPDAPRVAFALAQGAVVLALAGA